MQEAQKSYSQIVKSTAVIGGAQGITLLIGLVQTKFVAVFLGPFGVGLTSMFGSILALVTQISGLGIRTAGVREVARDYENKDELAIGRTVCTLKRVCWVTGLLGTAVLGLFSNPLSKAIFGTDEHAWALAMIAVIVLLRNVQGGQMAIIQGQRRIADLAKLQIMGAVAGVLVAVPIYAWLRLDGIVPVLLLSAVISLTFSWWIVRKIPVVSVPDTWRESLWHSRDLVILGLAFMWAALLIVIVNFTARWLVNFQFDLVAVGIYQSAFRLSSVFVGFILGAIGTDFYPRLATVADDHEQVNLLVNEQTEIGLLIAIPGLFATLALAPWVILAFYTSAFLPAGELLKWFVLGSVGRVIAVPLGYILVAKGYARGFAAIETAISVVHIFLIWVGIQYFGVVGVAIAYFLLYVIYTGIMLVIAHKVTGFRWSRELMKLNLVFAPLVVALSLLAQFLSRLQTTLVGGVLTVIVGAFCLYELTKRLGPDHPISKFAYRYPVLRHLVYSS